MTGVQTFKLHGDTVSKRGYDKADTCIASGNHSKFRHGHDREFVLERKPPEDSFARYRPREDSTNQAFMYVVSIAVNL